MQSLRTRWAKLALLSSGTLLASGCDGVTEQIVNTIRLALNIVNVWV